MVCRYSRYLCGGVNIALEKYHRISQNSDVAHVRNFGGWLMKWFVDKVLPALIISVLVYAGAQAAGLFRVGLDPTVKEFMQSWVPEKSIIFANGECPDGWLDVGIAGIDMAKIHDRKAVPYIKTGVDKDGFDTGNIYVHYCLRG